MPSCASDEARKAPKCHGSNPGENRVALRPGLSEQSPVHRDYAREHPSTAELVIELCVSSHEYDRSKIRAYASAGLKEVWLALAPERQIEVHRFPAGERFGERIVHGSGGRLASSAVSGFEVELEALFQTAK